MPFGGEKTHFIRNPVDYVLAQAFSRLEEIGIPGIEPVSDLSVQVG
jgi:hypothetical protein